MTCEMEVLDASGHVTLAWDPAEPESVGKAQAEFERLRAAGFAFFVVDGAAQVTRLKPAALAQAGALEARVGQVRTFPRGATRTVAVPPLRGG